MLIEVAESDARTVSRVSFVLAARVAAYVFHPETVVALNAEQEPFFPEALRALWDSAPADSIPPPDASFPAFRRYFAMSSYPPVTPTTDLGQYQATANELRSALNTVDSTDPSAPSQRRPCGSKLSSGYPTAVASSPYVGGAWPRLGWSKAFLDRLGYLLRCEEGQMQTAYRRMDVFSTPIRSVPSRRPHAQLTFACEVPGLQEQHPPVAIGDALLMRLHHLPSLEIGLRVVNVTRRTRLLLAPSVSAHELAQRAEITLVEAQAAMPGKAHEHPGLADLPSLNLP